MLYLIACPQSVRTSGDPVMAGEHLLVVDDEENLRSMLTAALRHHGFEISTATDGAEALAAAATVRPT
ncbi:MAG: hypothetical protein R2695_04565 [Acidimicrobiales bacterium]